jgi:hypothetical protein
MSTDKKKFFGKHKEGGKQKGAVEELGSNVYVSDVNGATDKFVNRPRRLLTTSVENWGSPCATW